MSSIAAAPRSWHPGPISRPGETRARPGPRRSVRLRAPACAGSPGMSLAHLFTSRSPPGHHSTSHQGDLQPSEGINLAAHLAGHQWRAVWRSLRGSRTRRRVLLDTPVPPQRPEQQPQNETPGTRPDRSPHAASRHSKQRPATRMPYASLPRTTVSPRGSSSTPSSTQNGRATGSPARSGISNHDRPEEEGSHLPGLRAPVAPGGPEMQPVVRLASWPRLRPEGLGAGCLRVYGRAVARSARAGRCGATTSIRCRAWPRAAESIGMPAFMTPPQPETSPQLRTAPRSVT